MLTDASDSFSHTGRPLAVGERVGGYQIERELAQGGMGTVYIANHTVLPRRAALKVLHPELAQAGPAREGLLHEACVLESMHDPSAARIYDAGVLDDGRPWIAMELIEGECLADRMARTNRVPLCEAAQIVAAIGEALSAAHANGVVHGDVKPENVILIQGRHGLGAKLIDWGISHEVQLSGATRGVGAGYAIGTPDYMAPEQVRGEPLDGRADIYALGVLAYELFTGDVPFRGYDPTVVASQHLTRRPPSIRTRRPELPAQLDELISAMLAKSPDDRPNLEGVRVCFSLAIDLFAPHVPQPDAPLPTAGDFDVVVDVSSREQPSDIAGGGPSHVRWTPPGGIPARDTVRLGRVVGSTRPRVAPPPAVIITRSTRPI